MNFRTQQPYDNKWKEKYLQLAHEQQTKDKQAREHEALLGHAIIRLTLAAKGLNGQLDPYLDRIHQCVKSGLAGTRLKADIDALSQAIRSFERKPQTVVEKDSALLLFGFLSSRFPDEANVRAITSIQSRYQNHEFSSNEQLFGALLKATATDTQTKPPDAGTTRLIDTGIIAGQLVSALDSLIIPFNFEEKTAQLKVRLQNHHAAQTFEPLLDDFVTLLVDIKTHLQSDQKDIENFLSQITKQLAELGLQAAGATAATQKTNSHRQKLDQYVSAQMQALRQSSDKATTPQHLKQLINTHIDDIAEIIRRQRHEEEKQRLCCQRHLDNLNEKIKCMETETRELRSMLIVANDKAQRDPLTGLANRLAYDERLQSELSHWQRYRTPLSLVICDIDKFKSINDTFGHRAGDKTLKIIAKLLAQHCRRLDFLSRFGGEEFTLILPNTNQTAALKFADRLRLIIEKTRFNYGDNSLSITISCGVSEFKENDNEESVFERADQALYQAKANGRNQCLSG